MTIEIGERLRSRPAADWARRLCGAGIPAVVADAETFEEHLLRMGMVEPASHQSVGDYFRLRPRIRFDGVEPKLSPTCSLGEHTASILAEIGYSPDQCNRLATERVISL